jgi:Zn-finger nucleic acid-binding protein
MAATDDRGAAGGSAPSPSIACPACGGQAYAHTLEGLYGRPVIIDACADCKGLWLDGFEALQLSPSAVLALVRLVDDPQNAARPPLHTKMACPRCGARLVPTQDRQRSTTFRYERCPGGHGRFISFFQFLRSRNFVRELTEDELRDLRSRIQSVNCSNCGAPVDVARFSSCSYCQTPISTVEPGQIRAAIEELQRAAEARQKVDPALPLTLLQQRAEVERTLRGAEERGAVGWLLDNERGGRFVESVLWAIFGKV